MRGSYHLREWEKTHWTSILFRKIEELLCGCIEYIDLTREDICFSNVEDILTELGYTFEEEEPNNHDFCWYFTNYHTRVSLVVSADVETFELRIYLRED